jgi:DNA-binding transcriptional ArsR family regulator
VIRIRLTPADLADVRLSSSALVELSESLRTAADPARQGSHRAWVDGLREDRARHGLLLVQALHEPGRYVPDFLTLRGSDGPAAPARELAELRARPAVELADSLAFAYPDGAPADVALLEREPEEGLRRLAAELEGWFALAVRPHWRTARALVEGEILRASRLLATRGPAALLSELHPGMWLRGDVLEIESRRERDVTSQGRGIRLVPAAFAGCEVSPMLDASLPLGIAYQPPGVANLLGGEAVPRDGLGPLLGPGRARLLHLLAAPSSTGELALRLGVTPPAVSQQLRILEAAGLVRSCRSGTRVLHELNDEGRELLDVLARAVGRP